MNRRIAILLVLVQLGCSSPIIAKRPINESQTIQQINALRASSAQAGYLANMHELSWDSDLASKAGRGSCEDLVTLATRYMVAVYPDMNRLKQIQRLSVKEQQKYADEKELGPFLIVVQTRIGCARLKQPCDGIEAACFIGPKSATNFNRQVDVKHGPPGSQCPNGKTTSSLLCTSSSSILSTAFIIVVIIFILILQKILNNFHHWSIC